MTTPAASSTCTTTHGASTGIVGSSSRWRTSPGPSRRSGSGSSAICPCAGSSANASWDAPFGCSTSGSSGSAENETYGLATLKKRQVRLEGGAAVFDYRAKGSKRHVQVVADAAVLPTIRALKRRRAGGAELFAYRNARSWHDVRSDEINEYLKDLAGGEFTAKDFRTWNASVLAAVALAKHDPDELGRVAHRRAVNEAVKDVAGYLSNTPSVCRSAYIDPRVIDRFDSGDTIRDALDREIDGAEPGEFPHRERIEATVLDLIR
jgi:DNA topoisomerase I